MHFRHRQTDIQADTGIVA